MNRVRERSLRTARDDGAMLTSSESSLKASPRVCDAVSDSAALRLFAESTDVAAIDAFMECLCVGEARDGARGTMLGRIAWEHIATGGKRLRARLALFGVQALGGRADDGVAWGAACELLHNASLIHDDIQDGDAYRRGTQALWARYGVAQAINAGDLCIALGYAALEAVPVSEALRFRLTKIVTRSSRMIVEGQAAELGLLAAEHVPTWSDYASCVEGKTSAFFSLPIEGAALIAGRSVEDAAALADTCRSLGVLFQIQDDILDLYGDNGRDLPGSDLAQSGKASAFVVEHLRLHPHDRDWLYGILTASREETPRASIDDVIARFADGGALEAVWRRIDEIRDALEASTILRAEPAIRELLRHFVGVALRPVEHTRASKVAG